MDLAIQTDAENDIVYIALSRRALKKGAAARSLRVDGDIALDLDAAGRLLGIEVMNASRRLGASASKLTLDTLVGVKEAAALAGVRRPNFIRDYADRPDFPAPIAELATGRLWLRSQVEQYVAARAKRTRRAS